MTVNRIAIRFAIMGTEVVRGPLEFSSNRNGLRDRDHDRDRGHRGGQHGHASPGGSSSRPHEL